MRDTSLALLVGAFLPSFAIALAPPLPSGSSIPPIPGLGPQDFDNARCMTQDQADQTLQDWFELIGSFTPEKAYDAMDEAFKDYSSSAADLNNQCRQAPMASPPGSDSGGALFSSRSDFMMGQGAAPALTGKMTGTPVYGCTSVAMAWAITHNADLATDTSSPPIAGVIKFDTVKNTTSKRWVMSASYSEFDVSRWVNNLKQEDLCCTPDKDGNVDASSHACSKLPKLP